MQRCDTKGLADLLHIESKYINRAIKSGQLKPGVHFIVIGGSKPIFEWSEELKKKLYESCIERTEDRPRKQKKVSKQINLASLGLVSSTD